MLTKENILKIAKQKGTITTRDLAGQFCVSRQYASALIAELVADNELLKQGSTRKAFYLLPEYAEKNKKIFPLKYARVFKNVHLEEHQLTSKVEKALPPLKNLPENIKNIFTYAFSEMLNNAIEHSSSASIGIDVSIHKKILSFSVSDSGIGVFRSIMRKRRLKSEISAIQDLMKGKTTTMPKSHSGEGIFFTSKAGDHFLLDSFGYQLIVNNEIPDIFVNKVKKIKKGTQVIFKIDISSGRYLNELFKEYTNLTKDSDYGFDKTKIQIKLYAIDNVHISRSQARRVLSGLEKFKIIVFDFDKVALAGQGFADEIFRVFHNKYPHITLSAVNMNEGVKFMVERAKKGE